MQRMGMVIGLKPEKVEEYKRLHAAVWPDVLTMISACNIKNYSIYLKRAGEPAVLLFRISRHGLCGRHGQDGGRPEDAGMVGRLHAMPGAAGDPQGGRMVGDRWTRSSIMTECGFDPASLVQSWPSLEAPADRHFRRRLDRRRRAFPRLSESRLPDRRRL